MPAPVIVGMKESKEVLDLVITLCRGIVLSMEDDKLTIADLPNFFAVLYQIIPAIEDIDQVAMEFKLASDEEAEELKQYLRDELDLEDDEMEKFIEDAFDVVLTIWQMTKKFFIKEALPDIEPQAPQGNGEISEDDAPEIEPVA